MANAKYFDFTLFIKGQFVDLDMNVRFTLYLIKLLLVSLI